MRKATVARARRVVPKKKPARPGKVARSVRPKASSAARRPARAKAPSAAALRKAKLAAARQKALRAKEIARAKAARVADAKAKARLAAEAKKARIATAKEKVRLAAEAKKAKLAAAREKARLAAEAKKAKVAAAKEKARLAAEAKKAKLAAAKEKARLAAEAQKARFAAAKEKARLADEARKAKIAAAKEKTRLADEARKAKAAPPRPGVAAPASASLLDEDLDDDLDEDEEEDEDDAPEDGGAESEPDSKADASAGDKSADGKGGKQDPRKAQAQRMTDSAFRLSPDFRPREYRVHVLPDLVQGKFRGELIIDLDLKRSTPSIELHCADIAIDHAEVAYPDVPDTTATRPWMSGRQPTAGAGPVAMRQTAVAIVPHAPRETVEIKFLRPLAAGRVKLSIGYHGPLQEKLRGLYKAQSNGRRYAFTQLEAADARRFFPCFDEPEYKAKFTFSVTTETNLTVISNSAVERVDRNAYGTATRHFRTTPRMSTYLCALAVGELESSPAKNVGKTPVRVWSAPGKSGLTAFSLDAAVECLKRLEAWFDLPYPYEKLDLVAVPDFEAGAMENVGAVFFRETLLLVDPDTITVAEKKRVAEVIAHELAHMWFGNLVTMKWWDDLWLNEAFATWMAFKIVDEWKPQWRMWNNFEPHRAAAMALDALANTHPVYSEVENAAQATENFDAITYEKGASVVRMLEHYLGPQKFRQGVRSYVRRHKESNAVAADLWKALEDSSGQPVAQVARAWIRQPGFPIVSFTTEEKSGTIEIAATQERFLASPTTRVPREDPPPTWPVPLVVKVGGKPGSAPKLQRELLRVRKGRVQAGPKAPTWIYGNAAEGGFYRVLHDQACLSALGAELQTALTPVERMGLVGHQWAAVRAGRAPLRSHLDLLSRLGDETDYEVLDTAAAQLAFLDDQVCDATAPDARAAVQEWIRATFAPAWAKLGWT
ncbi:MAG: M1 family metallopeptidase, partial [Alphaproteobacteria bacterium]